MRDMLRINGDTVEVTVNISGGGAAKVRIGEEEHEVSGVRRDGSTIEFVHAGRVHRISARETNEMVQVSNGAEYHSFARVIEGAEEDDSGADALSSQMPGTVLKTLVKPGTKVGKGTPLLILEAMKMEHEVCAPSDGTVTGYPYAEGQRVMPGDLLVEFE